MYVFEFMLKDDQTPISKWIFMLKCC